jgi:hypothetical protein
MARVKKKAVEVVKELVLSQEEALENKKELNVPSLSSETTEEIIEVLKELHRLEELKKKFLELEEAHTLKIMNFMVCTNNSKLATLPLPLGKTTAINLLTHQPSK